MRMVDIIQKKRDGKPLTEKEIEFVIQGYTNGTIPDYQISAFTMAVYFKGMTPQETAELTMAIVNSGETIDLSPVHGKKVDKHSTGGVGDKVSLIVGPLVASVGIPVAKMSGRGLGHTGGTIDKLESIPGFNVEMTREAFIANVNKNKIAIAGQSGNLTPADKKLYALRDVTATVESIPLIASSIMSKKIASGADAIVLDVKTGSGAFMKTFEEAKALAEEMVAIGKNLKRQTVAIISDMNEPLGYEIGNANEVKEAIRVLKGERIHDLRKISLTIASHMTVLGGIYNTIEEAEEKLAQILDEEKAIPTLRAFISSQGGDERIVENFDLLPKAQHCTTFVAEKSGFIESIKADTVGVAAMLLGAGRKTKEDAIDYSVGITLKKKSGETVNKGEVLAELHYNENSPNESIELLKEAVSIGSEPPPKRQMIYEIIQ